jgi:hypothetical protein
MENKRTRNLIISMLIIAIGASISIGIMLCKQRDFEIGVLREKLSTSWSEKRLLNEDLDLKKKSISKLYSKVNDLQQELDYQNKETEEQEYTRILFNAGDIWNEYVIEYGSNSNFFWGVTKEQQQKDEQCTESCMPISFFEAFAIKKYGDEEVLDAEKDRLKSLVDQACTNDEECHDLNVWNYTDKQNREWFVSYTSWGEYIYYAALYYENNTIYGIDFELLPYFLCDIYESDNSCSIEENDDDYYITVPKVAKEFINEALDELEFGVEVL